MKAAIYIRVSTDRQAEEGYSIEAQKDRLIAYAQSQDWGIAKIYIDDGYSAKDLERPRMKQMLADMENGEFDVVLVYKLDRLTRSVSDLHELLKGFERHEVKFKSATEAFETTTAVGRLFITLVAAIAAWERETTAERVRFSKEQMIKEGIWPGGKIPFGYDKNQNAIPEEVETLTHMRELYLSGKGYALIAKELNEKNRLRRGRIWHSSSVSYALNNPYYAGILRMGTKNSAGIYPINKEGVECVYGEGAHDQTYSVDQYEELKLERERRSTGGHSRIQNYWFAGVLRCGRCGSAMVGKTIHQNTKTKGRVSYLSYICTRRNTSKSCDMPRFSQHHVEHRAMQLINKIQADYSLMVVDEKKETKEQKEMKAARRKLQEVEERRSKWQYMFVENLIDPDTLRVRLQEEDRNEQEMKRWITDHSKDAKPEPKLEKMAELVELWPHLDDIEKKAFIQVVFSRIVIDTPLTNPKGVKNKFFESSITEVVFN